MSTAQAGSSSFPLDQSHYDAMNGIQQIVAQAMPILQKCADCGLPVEGEMNVLREREAFAAAVKRNFFPELP